MEESERYEYSYKKPIYIPDKIDKIKIDEITNAVYDQILHLDALRMPHTIQKSECDDDLRNSLKSVATDFVVAEFFATAASLYNFLSLVMDTFDSALKKYRDLSGLNEKQLFFIFKGGNILKIVSNEFLKEFPIYANIKIDEYYSAFFKRSDNDFSIFIDPSIENYEKTFNDITTLAYYLQDLLRDVFLTHPADYFDYSKYNDEYRKVVKNRWLNEFNNVTEDFVENKDENPFVSFDIAFSDPDFTSSFAISRNIEEFAIATLKDSKSIFRVTHNNALEFKDATDNTISFNLTRTKIWFQLEMRDGNIMKTRGELIDVSIPYKTDTYLKSFYVNLNVNITDYKLYYEKNLELKFKSLTIPYLAKDLSTILFKKYEFPWDDEKYIKRLNRLIYLYFVDIFIKIKNSEERLTVLKDVKELIINTISKKKNLSNLHKFEKKYPQLIISQFPKYIETVVNKINPKIIAEVKNLGEFAHIIDENINTLFNSINLVKKYCKTDGFANENDIYNAKFESLII